MKVAATEQPRMSDEIIKELWKTKDSIAREHGYDVDKLVAFLNSRPRLTSHQVVDLRTARGTIDRTAPIGRRTGR